MSKLTYREMAIETVKYTCQDIMDRVEELIPDVKEGVYDITLEINIPTLTDRVHEVPSYTLSVEGYVQRSTAEKIIDLEALESRAEQST